jgi:non-specific serine/threonine protein kinase
MLKTVSGRGYRLLGDWTLRPEGAARRPVGAVEQGRTPARTVRTNLPATAFELIGRTVAAQQIQDILSAYRAITLTGPGGIGKTTLALHVARCMCGTFDGGVWLVGLASLPTRASCQRRWRASSA